MKTILTIAPLAWLILALSPGGAAAAEAAHGEHVRIALEKKLPELDGKHLTVKLVDVTYEPGGASEAHSHPCPVVAYVTEGTIRSEVAGQSEGTGSFETGAAFYEAPNGVHAVSGNGSASKPARLLAIFVCDHEGPLKAPVPAK
jgi:quercetin dioxygenase-like cupin family protein